MYQCACGGQKLVLIGSPVMLCIPARVAQAVVANITIKERDNAISLIVAAIVRKRKTLHLSDNHILEHASTRQARQ